jgi:hypothetical protein
MVSGEFKRFRLNAADIRPLAEGFGSCIASDHITVEGKPVGFMYRESPDHPHDSGWRFLSGAESQDYLDKSENLAMYDVNTIANCDPSIIQFLGAPEGSAFGRASGGQFEPEDMPQLSDA